MQSLCRFVRRTGRLRLSARAFTNAGQGLRLKLPKYITLLKEEIHDARFVSLQILPNYAVSVLQLRRYHGYAEDQYSDDEYGVESNQGSGGNARVELWKQKLTVLRNSRETEIVSVDKRDRRDYDAIASLAQRIGLYSQIYGKAVVFSKAPLPNYRPDMDDKRPIRKVSIPLSVHRVVDGLLQEHVDRKEILPGNPMASGNTNVSNETRYSASRHEEETLSEDVLQRKSYHLHAKQRFWQESEKGKKMMELRMKLPAFKEKESILSAIAKNQVLVVSGETGCGKTTQLPQYILEAEIEAGRGASCSIICTQPRRISAISVAERVAAERGEELGESVGYKVRLEGMRGKNTRMLFCTTGILLRRLLVDPSLKGVSHVIVDEIHERGMNEDFLLIVLKDLLPRRPDLRLLLMSATLNAELFSSYFDGAPMCHIPGFTHPVTALFLEDVLEMTNYRLTEQNQLDNYGHDKNWKMQKQLQKRKRKDPFKDSVQEAYNRSEYQGYSDITQYSLSQWCSEGLGFNLIQAVLCHVCLKEREGAVLVFMTGWEDINALKDQLQCHPVLGDKSKVLVLPCHGAMATAEQKLIFDKPPGNVRKIVLATNMAETSITINDVVFVVDCGRAKETSYDALNNTPCLLPTWISKASARQRRGRAGRVQPGKCYHLYPRAVYDGLLEYQVPELLRTPLHSLCLQIKSLRLGSIMGFLSKALQPPELLSVQNAVDLLKTMGALDDNEELTYLGQHLSILPVEPRIGKMLIMGCIFRCLDPVLTIAAGLTLRDPFVLPSDKKLQAERARYKFGEHDASDHIALVRAYDGWVHAMKEGTAAEYCWGNFLSFQSLQAMQSLRNQFKSLLTEAGFLGQDAADYNQFSPDHEVLGGVICAGLFPGIAAVLSKTKAATFKTMEDGQVLLYQNSVLSKMQKIPYPWLAFNEKVKTGTVIIRDSTGVSDSMVLLFCGKVALGDRPGQLLMQDGKLEFYMLPDLAKTIYQLNGELNEMLCTKLKSPKIDVYKESRHLMEAILELLHGDRNEGSFGIGLSWIHGVNIDKNDAKCTLQNMVQKAGYPAPEYKHRVVNNNLFQAKVEIMNQRFIGRPASSKKQAEKNVAADAIEWLTRGPNSGKKSQIVAGRVSEKSEHNTKTKGEGKMIELVDKRRGERKAEDKVKATVETEKARVLRAQIRQVIKGYKRKPNELSMEGS